MPFKHSIRAYSAAGAAEKLAKAKVRAEMLATEAANAEAEKLRQQRQHRYRGRVIDSLPELHAGLVEVVGIPPLTETKRVEELVEKTAALTVDDCVPIVPAVPGPGVTVTAVSEQAAPKAALFLWSEVRGLGCLAAKPGDVLSFRLVEADLKTADVPGSSDCDSLTNYRALRPTLIELAPRSNQDWLAHISWLTQLWRNRVRPGLEGDNFADANDEAACDADFESLIGALRAKKIWTSLIGCCELSPEAGLRLCALLPELASGGMAQFSACLGACLSQLLPPLQSERLQQMQLWHLLPQRQRRPGGQFVGKNYFLAALRKALFRNLPKAAVIVGSFVRLCTSDPRRTAAYLPQLAHVVATAAKVVSKKPDQVTDAGSSQLLLVLLRRQLGSRLPDSDDEDFDDDADSAKRREGAWLDLQPVPSDGELLREAGYLRGLEPVMVKGPYRSADHYYDTYFRLFRADCFERIVHGITDFRSGRLDPRDMPLYGRVRVWAVRLSTHSCPLSVAVQFTELSAGSQAGGGGRLLATNWRKSSRLMQGNLVCLSTNGRFDPDGGRCPLIWATVCARNVDELEKHSVVWLELGCGGAGVSGCLTDTAALQALVAATPSGATLMAESPSLFRAFEPVLRSLQASGAALGSSGGVVGSSSGVVGSSGGIVGIRRKLPPFRSVLVDADMTEASARPEYIDAYYRANGAALPTVSTGAITLDECQQRALRNALHRRVALIQGPPGTGKSFLGVLLMRQILALPTLPSDRPVLVMSYKNHALDEFLSDLMDLYPDQIVRVGGRCSNERLESVSLNTLRKDKEKHPKSRKLNQEFFHAYQESEARQAELKSKLDYVSKLLSQPGTLVRAAASDAQLRTLLVNWRPMMGVQQTMRLAAVEEWKKLNKGIDDPVALSQWLAIPDVSSAVRTAIACWLPTSDQLAKASAISADSAASSAVESNISKVLSDFERRCQQTQIGFRKNKKQQQKRTVSAGDSRENADEDDTEQLEFQLQQRLSAFIFQINKQRRNDAVVNFGRQDGLTAGFLTMDSAAPAGRLMAQRSDLWRLDVGEKCELLKHWLQETVTMAMAGIETKLADYLQVSESRRRLQRRHCAEIVKSKRILGMTITGASINKDLIAAVRPAVILVEEAAEVGEPQLLSCLTDSTQHLILIGDHKQLRPQTESYDLRIKYHLDLSMFERLINNGIPYDQLELQNRMRPEFSRLLLDIYPNLRDNLAVVSKREQIPCLEKSMYFWTHTSPEVSDRSYTNEEEALRAVQLACFLASVGEVDPNRITIIAMYRGQTALIRRYLKKEMILRGLLPPLPQAAGPNQQAELPISVHTVDLYQGDENDVIIVSLVRSNTRNRLGFLKDLNRRCVAQSRARRGMYILGNADCLAGSPEHDLWRRLIEAMSNVGCLGPRLTLVCPRHRDCDPPQRFEVIDSAQGFPSSLNFCDRICNTFMDCGLHKCQRECRSARHSHANCSVLMDFLYNGCSHPGQRQCSEDPADLVCQARVPVTCAKCKQTDFKPCRQPLSEYECPQPCLARLPCGHACPGKCGEPCSANPADCRVCREAERLRVESIKKQSEEIQSLARQEARDEYERLKSEPDEVRLIDIECGSSEFFDIEDRVTKFVQLCHGWFPKVRSIQRLRNPKLRKRFLIYRQNTALDATRVELKFHGTSAAGVDGITKQGFRLPEKPGMFGAGIYFASDASKSAQELYTKGSHSLLLCEVLLGRSLAVTQATNDKYNWKTLRQEKYDSIFAPRDTKSSGGVLFDEFVVFNPDQAFPKYVIRYESISGTAALKQISQRNPTLLQAPKAGNKVVKITAQQALAKPEDSPEYIHYNIVNSQFLASFTAGSSTFRVTEIWHNSNPLLEQKFAVKKAEFEAKYGAEHEYAKAVFAFHGTKTAAIVDSIMAGNFDLKLLHNFLHGYGVYLSEFADVSVGYGREMLLCRVLPGKPQDGGSPNQHKGPGFDSIRANKNTEGRGWALVIDNVDQILPLYKVVFQ